METSTVFSHVDSVNNFSTGYLEDVLLGFSSKRRRLMTMFAEDRQSEDLNNNNSIESCWNCLSFDSLNSVVKSDTIGDATSPPEEANSETYDSSSSSQKGSVKEKIFSSAGPNEKINRKRAVAQVNKVVYPFALIKPGGFDGDITLNDINERILMPPTRPVRHPVGDFACRPVLSPQGRGFSGKTVVAFMRIYTQGRRGTITIIRTRG